MTLRRALLALLALVAVAPCARAAPDERALTVAAAANLRPALEELAARFRAGCPAAEVRLVYGASGNLLAQAVAGAPFDLFLSADADYPAQTQARGLAAAAPFVYAYGRLAVWTPAGSPLDLAGRGLAALEDPAVRRLAAANPAAAPYGRLARAALEKAGLLERLREKLVLGESVAQAAQFAESGHAQAALLPLSLALAPPLDRGRAWPVPDALAQPLAQAGVVLRSARAPALARAFAAFLVGDEARAVLARHGYALPPR